MSTGFLAALVAKLGAIPTAAKAAVATLTALTTMTVAGAAANSLPSFAQGPVASAINAVSPLNLPTGTDADSIDVNASVDTPAGSAGANANFPVGVPGLPALPDLGSGLPTVPGLPDLGNLPNVPGLPDLGGLPQVPGLPEIPGLPNVPGLPALPACVTNLIPAGGAAPDPTALLGQLPACIQEVLASSGLPVNVEQCVASVLGTLTGVLNPGAIGTLPNLNVSSCIPLDTTSCTSNTLAAASTVPDVKAMLDQIFSSFGGFGNWSNFLGGVGGTIPGLDQLPAGCVPVDVQACIASITGALGTLPSGAGSVPQLNLSACMPTGLTSGIPGLGGGIPGLGGLPFFPF